MRIIAAGILAALTLSGCDDPRVEQVQKSRSTLVGMEKETLLACAGVPERAETTDKAEFLTYENKYTYSRPGYGVGFGFGHHRWRRHGFGFQSGFYFPYDYDQRTVGCKATFTLEDNKVSGVTYGGVGEGSVRLRQCYTVVENCLNAQVAAQ